MKKIKAESLRTESSKFKDFGELSRVVQSSKLKKSYQAGQLSSLQASKQFIAFVGFIEFIGFNRLLSHSLTDEVITYIQ